MAQVLDKEFLKTVKCPTDKAQQIYADSDYTNLILVVAKSGKKTWHYKYRLPTDKTKTRLPKIGTTLEYKTREIVWACEKLAAIRDALKAGKDPEAVAASKIPEKTFGELWNVKWEQHTKFLDSADEVKRIMEVDVIPAIGKVLLSTLEISHAKLVTDPIKFGTGKYADGSPRTEPAPIQANRVFEQVRATCRWGIKNGYFPKGMGNPIELMERPTKKERDDDKDQRFLDRGEIRKFWLMIGTVMSHPLAHESNVPDILRLELCTGQRPSECASIRVKDINQETRMWTLNREMVKNNRKHTVFLNDMAWAIVEPRIAAAHGKSKYLFPNSKGEWTKVDNIDQAVSRLCALPKSEMDKPEDERDRTSNRIGIAKFTPHALRHTFVTQMLNDENEEELGFSEKTVSRLVNHVSGVSKDGEQKPKKQTVTGKVYDHNTYERTMVRAMMKWNNWLQKVISEEPQAPKMPIFRLIKNEAA